LLDRRLRRSDATVFRVIDGVALVADAAEGKLRTLNRVATFIWERADGSRTLAELARAVCQEFDVDYARAARDVEAFAAELIDRGMLVVESHSDAEAGR
jgi:hypothetical protein